MAHEMTCPYCKGAMSPIKARCTACGVAIEGSFRQSRVARLPAEQAAFLAEYVLAGFSVKALEERVGMSYPAVRARLDRIIESMRKLSEGPPRRDGRRREILDRLESGEIKVDEAVRLLEGL